MLNMKLNPGVAGTVVSDLSFFRLQVIYMGLCVYTPAFALNAGTKSSHYFTKLLIDEICGSVCHCVFFQLLDLNCGEQFWPLD